MHLGSHGMETCLNIRNMARKRTIPGQYAVSIISSDLLSKAGSVGGALFSRDLLASLISRMCRAIEQPGPSLK
ncbi:MAG: hypothetical protein JWR26_1482 [Pedosphaera sp.]|nr:hypothetical protein [Pedosphaera sp.]